MTSPHQPEGPQSPTPDPQSPAPQGPPPGPQSPAPGPQSPQYAPPPGAPPHQYGGPVPPGGWHQPPPQPALTGQLASWGSRVAAYAIDFLIVAIPSLLVIVFLVFGAIVSGDGGFIAFMLGVLLSVFIIAAVALLYAPLLMIRQGAHNGQTIGKQLVGVRAVRDNGQAWTFGPAALREVVMKNLAVGVASSVVPLIPWFLNFFWPLWDDQNRALHDMAVSSHVVRA